MNAGKIIEVIRIALDIQGAVESKHTRAQLKGLGISLMLASVVIAGILVAAPGVIPTDIAATLAFAVAALISPLISRGIGKVSIVPPDLPTIPPLPEKPIPREDYVLAIRGERDQYWTALDQATPKHLAWFLGVFGYNPDGVEINLRLDQPTGRTVKVPPSLKKKFDEFWEAHNGPALQSDSDDKQD